MHVHICVHVWKPEFDAEFFLITLYLAESDSLSEPRAHCYS